MIAEVLVRGGDHPDVDLPRLRGAERQDLALLERAQELRLQRFRQVADLVEEEAAALGLEEEARARIDAGRDARLDAEELGLEQLGRDRGAVDRQEGPGAARAAHVDRLGDQFLAGARLAKEQDVEAAPRGGRQVRRPASPSPPTRRARTPRETVELRCPSRRSVAPAFERAGGAAATAGHDDSRRGRASSR